MKNSKESGKYTAVAVNSPAKFGDIVRLHRKKADLSQSELADLSGTGKTVIFDIEKGKPTVKLNTLLKVFKTLNISISLDSPIIGTLEK